MPEITTFYETVTGRINAIEFVPKKPAEATLLCIHGFCCNSRIFAYVGRKLSDMGYNLVSIDLPGHNMSDGEKGDLDFDECIKSIHQIVSNIKKSGTRVFLLTHSMGCIFALWYAHLFKASIDGLILLCPFLRVHNIKKRYDAEPNAFKLLLLLLASTLTPNKRFSIIDEFPEYVNAGGDELAWMIKDQSFNFSYSYRFVVDILAKRNSKLSELTDLGNVPVLILHGSKDRMIYLQVSQEFFKLVKSEIKDLKIFDCDHWFYDAIFFDQSFSKHSEESRTRVISTIAEWLRYRIDKR
jgi:alpha-beta hydrolase superfamily lysophospholipase